MKRYLLLFLSTLITAVGLQAQKVGFINTQEIFVLLPEVKQANTDLEVMKDMFRKKGEEMLKELQMTYQELQQKQANGELSPLELDRKTAELKEAEQELMTFEKASQDRLYNKSEELLGPIKEKVEKAISDVANENGLLYVFDNSSGQILYADENANISKLVKAKLNIK